MWNKILTAGLLSASQLSELSSLAVTAESESLAQLLTDITIKYKKSLLLTFYLGLFSTLYTFCVIAFSPYIFDFKYQNILILFLISLVIGVGIVFVKVNSTFIFDKYYRIIEDLFDSFLSFTTDTFKNSLSDVVPSFPSSKELAHDLGQSAKSLFELHVVLRHFLGIVLGTLIVFSIWAISQAQFFYEVSVLSFFLVVIFLLIIVYSTIYEIYQVTYKKSIKLFDRNYLETQPLLIRTRFGFLEKSYSDSVSLVSKALTKISALTSFSTDMLPFLLIFVPVIFIRSEYYLVYLALGFFISTKLFPNSVVRLVNNVYLGNKRLQQITYILNSIQHYSSELSPDKYDLMQKNYLATKNLPASDRIIWGEYAIENLKYTIGRGQNAKTIFAPQVNLPFGKVSFLIGEVGSGKSIFGRLLTLRYADFAVDFIGVGSKDIRSFTSLDSGLRYLHFSGMRTISTSYRNALSVYLKKESPLNLFVNQVFEFDTTLDKVYDHFSLNNDYYNELNPYLLPLLEKQSFQPTQKDLAHGYANFISELYQSFSNHIPLGEVLPELRKSSTETSVDKCLVYAAIAEYISYNHLKKYMPEATLYFMDAIISEPPISEAQKRRMLLALDVFMEGLVFVVDEPFTNLAIGVADKIMQDLYNYAKEFNAVVLILDEKLYPELISKYERQDALGAVLRFEEEAKSTTISQQDITAL